MDLFAASFDLKWVREKQNGSWYIKHSLLWTACKYSIRGLAILDAYNDYQYWSKSTYATNVLLMLAVWIQFETRHENYT